MTKLNMLKWVFGAWLGMVLITTCGYIQKKQPFLTAALRCTFDNSEFGQQYFSENSFSGVVDMYLNTLFCGTPAAVQRFYPNDEDGLMSRTLFVALPDQYGKPLPLWGKFTKRERPQVSCQIRRLHRKASPPRDRACERFEHKKNLPCFIGDPNEEPPPSAGLNEQTEHNPYPPVGGGGQSDEQTHTEIPQPVLQILPALPPADLFGGYDDVPFPLFRVDLCICIFLHTYICIFLHTYITEKNRFYYNRSKNFFPTTNGDHCNKRPWIPL